MPWRKGKKVRDKDKNQKLHYTQEVRICEKQQKLSEKQEKGIAKLEEPTDHALENGIWKSREDIDEKLQEYQRKKNCVWAQPVKSALTKCSQDELKKYSLTSARRWRGKNVNQIFQTICNSQYMVSKAIIHRWEENGKDSWYNGVIENLEEQEYRILYDNNNEPFLYDYCRTPLWDYWYEWYP